LKGGNNISKWFKMFVFVLVVFVLIFGSIGLISIKISKKNYQKGREHQNSTNCIQPFKNAKQVDDLTLLKRNANKQITPWGVKATIKRGLNIKNGVKVAILDSGIKKNHPDLQNVVIKEFDAINSISSSKTEDVLGHGTAVAGIIAAQDNSIGVIGVNPDSILYSVKVLDEKGKGTLESVVKGINWCIEQHVNIINISFGFKADSDMLRKTVNKAINSGIIVVAAAGNNYIGNADFPARYKNVISVGSLDQNYNLLNFSLKGKVDVVAPGKDILSTNIHNSYSLYNGTSMSAAFVTGLFSLLIGSGYDMTSHAKVMTTIKKKSISIKKLQCKSKYDYRMLIY
jgi:subtilisin family serine protease